MVDQAALEAYPVCDFSRFTGTVSASEACGIEPSMQLPLCEPRSLSPVSFNVQTLAGMRPSCTQSGQACDAGSAAQG